MARQSIAGELERAEELFGVLEQNAELRALLEPVGYGTAAIAEGRGFLDRAMAARTAAHGDHGDQLDATVALETLQKQVQGNVAALSELARGLLRKDVGTLERLGLRRGQRATPEMARSGVTATDGTGEAAPSAGRSMSRSLGAVLDRGRTLYAAILGDAALQAQFAAVGYAAERLTAEQGLLEELAALNSRQEIEKAEAQAAVRDQREALEQLRGWVSRFKTVARSRLRDEPTMLAALGL